MLQFINLFATLDNTTRSSLKQKALADYFATTTATDASWTLFFLMGKRLQKVVPLKIMKQVAYSIADIPEWLFKECYDRVGDLSETISLIASQTTQIQSCCSLTEFIQTHILNLKATEEKITKLTASYSKLSKKEIFLLNKFITGQFRVGVSKGLILKSMSQVTGLNEALIGQRLLGDWQPTAEFYQQLITPPNPDEAKQLLAKPFMLSHPLTETINHLQPLKDWQIEWKWDGIRAQLIVQNGNYQLWSRGEELINESFPEIIAAAKSLKFEGILDGEILAYKDTVLSFQNLQKRINRKKVSKKLLAEIPCIFYAFDLLYLEHDLREEPLEKRRQLLEAKLQSSTVIKPCEVIEETDITVLSKLQQQSRHYYAEGFMLKHKNSPYVMGRKTGLWWKWKIAPMTIDAVLVQAQRGHGRRAGLYSDYTFAVWQGNELISFAKAYSGLTDAEMNEVNSFIKKNILETYGPVAAVKPVLVFEIAFENIQISNRHKAGVAVRFPRILRARPDKTIEQANTLEDLKALLKLYEQHD